MSKNPRSMTYGLMYFLVALSTLGVIVASQQYLILQSEEEVILARRTLDESFLSAIRVAGAESNPEIAQRLAHQKTTIEDTYMSAAALIRQLKMRALADTIAWCVVLALSGWALIANGPKKYKASDPPAVSSASAE